jgi:eukaryotic-like serine/threonine-protein kinase
MRHLPEHVDACPSCQTLVAEAVRALHEVPAAPSGERGLPRTLRIGEVVLGRYEVLRFIGAGGMGEVYEARDGELGESIALKTLALPILDDPRAVMRLKAEVLLARRTTHPNVCRIFDFGVHQRAFPGRDTEEVPFLTMELLRGETLGQRLRQRGPLTVAEARPIVAQVLAGLAAVHHAGIIHRDLKPENVFLVPERDRPAPRVALMDFGLARPALASFRASLSTPQSIVGTLGYMAPEQLEGAAVSPASDIYAFGILLFELLTGTLPFTGGTPLALALARLHMAPIVPTTLLPGLDPVWERGILRCLARAPQERFQSAEEVTAAFVGPVTPPPRARPRRWAVAALGGLGVAVLAVVVVRGQRPEVAAPAPPAAIPIVPVPESVPEPLPPKAREVVATPDREGATGSGTGAGTGTIGSDNPKRPIRPRPRSRGTAESPARVPPADPGKESPPAADRPSRTAEKW